MTNTSNCPIMDEEYLSISGASRQNIGDSAFHKNKGNNSEKTWSKRFSDFTSSYFFKYFIINIFLILHHPCLQLYL